MRSKFVLTIFFTVAYGFSGSATTKDTIAATSQSNNSTQDNVLPDLNSFLIANSSHVPSRSSQTKFRRRHVMRRNTPGEFKGITVPLSKTPHRTQYTGEVEFPDHKKKLEVVFGTAAFDMWFYSDDSKLAVKSKSILAEITGKSRKIEDKSFKVYAFGGFGMGDAYENSIKIGGISQRGKPFGVLRQVQDIPNNGGYGVIPMARIDHSRFPNTKSFLKQAIDDHTIEPVFAFSLNPKGLMATDGGELHLGMIDNKHDPEYHDCDMKSPFWTIGQAKITIGSYTVENVRTVFDTGSRYFRGPENEVQKIYDAINIKVHKLEDGRYYFSGRNMRKQSEEMQLTIKWGNGKAWAIPGKRFIQGSALTTRNSVGLFAAHTRFTSRFPEPERSHKAIPVEPQLSRPGPHPGGLKPQPGPKAGALPPHAGEVVLPRPQGMPGGSTRTEPHNQEMVSGDKLILSPPLPEITDWIIPYPFMEDKYVIFDGRGGKCRIGIATPPT